VSLSERGSGFVDECVEVARIGGNLVQSIGSGAKQDGVD
jgi:hypothetical protein